MLYFSLHIFIIYIIQTIFIFPVYHTKHKHHTSHVGATLAPEKLAMGQSYEQLDKNEEGRLGKRKLHINPTFFSMLFSLIALLFIQFL